MLHTAIRTEYLLLPRSLPALSQISPEPAPCRMDGNGYPPVSARLLRYFAV
ncbi:hypothetical protein D1872_217950 [compost metagenome]